MTSLASDAETSPAPPPPLRKLYRSAEGRWVGGVARGLAGHLAVPVGWVRCAFAVLGLAHGLGVLLYAAFWFVVPLGRGGVGAESGARRRPRMERGQVLAIAAMFAGGVVLVENLHFGRANGVVWPLLLMGLGVALFWRQADDARRARWAEATRRHGLVRGATGVLLVVAGISGILVVQGSARDWGPVLQAVLAVLVGVALLTGPYLVRMMQDLSDERLLRIRAQERAEVAAHVHDSVLHTLTLIQRSADSPREVARLARAQERELRNWLYRPQGDGKDEGDRPRMLAEAVRAAAAGVEDQHGAPLEVVCVGDCPLDERLGAQIQAAREAMVNAAKYGGGGPVQVFAEVADGRVFVSVRDRGPGFDPERIPEDRMGVRESVVGRMRRNGGTARVRSRPGEGTEVELEMDLHGGTSEGTDDDGHRADGSTAGSDATGSSTNDDSTTSGSTARGNGQQPGAAEKRRSGEL